MGHPVVPRGSPRRGAAGRHEVPEVVRGVAPHRAHCCAASSGLAAGPHGPHGGPDLIGRLSGVLHRDHGHRHVPRLADRVTPWVSRDVPGSERLAGRARRARSGPALRGRWCATHAGSRGGALVRSRAAPCSARRTRLGRWGGTRSEPGEAGPRSTSQGFGVARRSCTPCEVGWGSARTVVRASGAPSWLALQGWRPAGRFLPGRARPGRVRVPVRRAEPARSAGRGRADRRGLPSRAVGDLAGVRITSQVLQAVRGRACPARTERPAYRARRRAGAHPVARGTLFGARDAARSVGPTGPRPRVAPAVGDGAGRRAPRRPCEPCDVARGLRRH